MRPGQRSPDVAWSLGGKRRGRPTNRDSQETSIIKYNRRIGALILAAALLCGSVESSSISENGTTFRPLPYGRTKSFLPQAVDRHTVLTVKQSLDNVGERLTHEESSAAVITIRQALDERRWDWAAQTAISCLQRYPESIATRKIFLEALVLARFTRPSTLKAIITCALDMGLYKPDYPWGFELLLTFQQTFTFRAEFVDVRAEKDDYSHVLDSLSFNASDRRFALEEIRVHPTVSVGGPMLAMVHAVGDLTLEKDEVLVRRVVSAVLSILGHTHVPDTVRLAWYSCLGQLYSMLGEARRAFDNWTVANSIDKRLWEHHDDRGAFAAAMVSLARELRAGFLSDVRQASMAPLVNAGNGLRGNLVVTTGFPRSGTTLLDRMLSLHPAVKSTGESSTLEAVYEYIAHHAIERRSGLAYEEHDHNMASKQEVVLDHVRQLKDSTLHTYRRDMQLFIQSVLQEEDGLDSDAAPRPYRELQFPTHLVTNNNYDLPFLWVPPLLAPDSKILVIIRDPRDVGFSCFKNSFSMNSWMFSDLRTIGRTIRAYFELLKAYQSHPLPEARLNSSQLLVVRYENLVSRPRVVLSHVLEFLELPWDERCLYPEKSDVVIGQVSDKSITQLKRGLQSSSIGSWRQYSDRLAPLLEELGELPLIMGYEK